MKKDSIINPIKFIKTIFNRFSLVLFIVIITGGLILSIFMLNDILARLPNISASSSKAQPITFDQSTINLLNKLKSSSEDLGTQKLPAGRTNPFFE